MMVKIYTGVTETKVFFIENEAFHMTQKETS